MMEQSSRIKLIFRYCDFCGGITQFTHYDDETLFCKMCGTEYAEFASPKYNLGLASRRQLSVRSPWDTRRFIY